MKFLFFFKLKLFDLVIDFICCSFWSIFKSSLSICLFELLVLWYICIILKRRKVCLEVLLKFLWFGINGLIRCFFFIFKIYFGNLCIWWIFLVGKMLYMKIKKVWIFLFFNWRKISYFLFLNIFFYVFYIIEIIY